MRDKIRIELSSENRLGWEPFYAVLELPATAQQIKNAKQKARISGGDDVTFQTISILGFDPLPDLEHLRLDTTSVEELNYFAQRLDSLSDEQFTILQQICPDRASDLRRVQNSISQVYMDGWRKKENRLAMYQPPRLWQEILPQISDDRRKRTPRGYYGCDTANRHAEYGNSENSQAAHWDGLRASRWRRQKP